MWGAIPMPWAAYHTLASQPSFFSDANLTPAIFFHGYMDQTFPLVDGQPFSQNVNLSPNKPDTEKVFNSVTFCIKPGFGAFTVDTTATSPDVINGSSYNAYRILSHYGITSELYVDCSMGHGLDNDGPGYGSNFGTSDTSQIQTEFYMSSRIAVRFQKILHPPGTYGKTVFVDCENTSKTCTTNTNCTIHACGGDEIDF
jgi:hypothetical protein